LRTDPSRRVSLFGGADFFFLSRTERQYSSRTSLFFLVKNCCPSFAYSFHFSNPSAVLTFPQFLPPFEANGRFFVFPDVESSTQGTPSPFADLVVSGTLPKKETGSSGLFLLSPPPSPFSLSSRCHLRLPQWGQIFKPIDASLSFFSFFLRV